MEFLVEFDVTVPDGTAQSVADERFAAEAKAAARLGRQGHWLQPGEVVPSSPLRASPSLS